MQGRASASSLFRLVQNDLESALKVLVGMFLIGTTFSLATMPFCLRLLNNLAVPINLWSIEEFFGDVQSSHRDRARQVQGDCSIDYTVHLQWLLLVCFLVSQGLQIPFRVKAFLDVLRISYKLTIHRRSSRRVEENGLFDELKTAMNGPAWRVNQFLGFLGQYLVPVCGLILWTLVGDSLDKNACFLDQDASKRPSSVWGWLMLCVIGRVLVSFLWGFYTTGHHLEIAVRGANESMLDRLDILTFKTSGNHHLTRCAICISDFEDGDYIARLPCNTKHIFHKSCVFQWLRRCKACPLCMRDIDFKGKSS